ncbi:MAG TPA: TolC family protein [Thermodesulfobacteriota bacterium]|nr:TolC family protein [Thermodesulfobacteriota bacterium]
MKVRRFIGFILLTMVFMSVVQAQESQAPLTLEESIKIAMQRSLALNIAALGVAGSEFRRKEAVTSFLPTWIGDYSWTRTNQPVLLGVSQGTLAGATGSGTLASPAKDIYSFHTSLNQPIFTGGRNLANYRFAKLGVDLSKTGVETAKLDVVEQVKVGYFTVLRAEKFLAVAEQQVKNFEAQLGVTKAFFDVGIVPKNDVLQAEVQLANAQQSLVNAGNALASAKAQFNTLLIREVNTPFEVVDILAYKAFPLSFEQSLEEAVRLRPEIKAAQLSIDQAKENVKIARSGFFPTIGFTGGYTRSSNDFDLSGGGNFNDQWQLGASASFTIWNWGNTAFQVGENKVKVSQAEDSKTQLVLSITLAVKNDYLNMLAAEKNIRTAEKAVEQAEENLRMFEERYRYQVATQTDVLIAVTLLAQARTNYYGALSDFNVAKAQLERDMGRMYP